MLDSVLQSVKIWLKFGKYQKNVVLRSMGRGNGGRNSGGDGAGRSKSTKAVQKCVWQRPGGQARRTVEKMKGRKMTESAGARAGGIKLRVRCGQAVEYGKWVGR